MPVGYFVTRCYFEASDHSLLIPQIMHRLEQAFGIALPLRALVGAQTVAELGTEGSADGPANDRR